MNPRCGQSLPRQTRWIACLLCLVLASVEIYTFFPGYLTHDSAYQWWQARSGEISSLWPPGMILLLRGLDQIGGGPAVLFVTHLLVYWATVAWLAARMSSLRRAVAVVLTFALLPVASICMPHVWIDVELTVVLMLVSALLAAASRTSSARSAALAVMLAVALMAFASIVRHNAIFALAPLCWAAVRLWPRAHVVAAASAQPLRLSATAAASAMLFGGLCAFYALTVKAVSATQSDTWAITAIWDLQALSAASGKVWVPRTISRDATIEDLTQSFDPVNAVTLYVKGRSQWVNATTGLTAAQAHDLQYAWLTAVTAQPLAYLAHRAHAFGKMLGPRRNAEADGSADDPVRVAFKDNPVYPLSHPDAIALARRWINALKPQWWASPLVWMVGATLWLAGGLLIRRRSIAHSTVAVSVWASGIFYLLPLFFFAPTADLRYALWPTVACVFAVCIAMLPDQRRT